MDEKDEHIQIDAFDQWLQCNNKTKLEIFLWNMQNIKREWLDKFQLNDWEVSYGKGGLIRLMDADKLTRSTR